MGLGCVRMKNIFNKTQKKAEKKADKKRKALKLPKLPKVPKLAGESGGQKKPKQPKAPGRSGKTGVGGKKFTLPNLNSIMARLVMMVAIPVMLLIVLGVVSYNTASRAIISNFEEANMSTISKTADYFGLIFDNVFSTSTEIVSNSTLKNYYSRIYKSDLYQEGEAYADVQKYIYSISTGNDKIKDIYITCSYGSDIRTSLVSNIAKFYDEFKETEEAAEIDSIKKGFRSAHAFFDEKGAGTDYAFTFVREVCSNSTKPCGYLFMDIDGGAIYEAIQELDMGEGSVIALVLPDGNEISAVKGKNAEDDVLNIVRDNRILVSDKDFFKGILADEEQTEGYKYVDYNGSKHLFLYSRIEEHGFTVCALVPRAVITAQAKDIRNITVAIVIVAFLVAVFIGSMISIGMTNAMKVMMEKLEAASNGDLTVHVSLKRKDEFRKLSGSVNNMISKTKGMIEDTIGISDELGGAAETVSGNSKVLLDATENITAAINEIEQGVIQQAADSDNCMKQMDMLAEKMNAVSESANKIASAAGEAITTVNNGRMTIGDLSDKASDTVRITGDIIEGVESLESASRQIESIIGAINEIADQTSLLSLNASIEAARAGEAGRGFAVVADEIRKLADQSSASANQIKKIIDDINEKTAVTVETAKKASEIVENQGESLSKTIAMFNQIEHQVENLVGELSQISVSIQGMENSKNETMLVMESISAVSEETAAMVEEVNATAERQLAAVQKLNSQAEDLSVNSERLISTVGAFKV